MQKSNFTSVGDRSVQGDDGHVSSQSVGVPVGVNGVLSGTNGDLRRFCVVPVLGSHKNRKDTSSISALKFHKIKQN